MERNSSCEEIFVELREKMIDFEGNCWSDLEQTRENIFFDISLGEKRCSVCRANFERKSVLWSRMHFLLFGDLIEFDYMNISIVFSRCHSRFVVFFLLINRIQLCLDKDYLTGLSKEDDFLALTTEIEYLHKDLYERIEFLSSMREVYVISNVYVARYSISDRNERSRQIHEYICLRMRWTSQSSFHTKIRKVQQLVWRTVWIWSRLLLIRVCRRFFFHQWYSTMRSESKVRCSKGEDYNGCCWYSIHSSSIVMILFMIDPGVL